MPFLAGDVQPDAAPTPSPMLQPFCASGDLVVSAGELGRAFGSAGQTVDIASSAVSVCRVSGRVGVATPAGQLLAAWSTPDVVLDHGQQAELRLTTPSCTTARPVKLLRTVVVRLGAVQRTVSGLTLDQACGRVAINVLNPPAARTAAARPGSLASLTVSRQVPTSISAGLGLVYTVTLTNSTGTSVALQDCPTFTQHLFLEGDGSVRDYRSTGRLNCAGAGGSIAAHSSRRFLMAMPVPADAPAGNAKLTWTVDRDPTVGFGYVLTVLR